MSIAHVAAPALGPLTSFDHLLIPAIVAVSIAEGQWYWPRMSHTIAAGSPGARMRAYRNILIEQWAFAAWVIALWVALGRPWGALWLGGSTPLRLAIGGTMAALFVALAWAQWRKLLADPVRLQRVFKRLTHIDPLVPRTSREARVFRLVSVNAGVCEELVFRGFIMAYVRTFAGPVAAVAVSAIVFGIGHYYLGLPHVLKSAIYGAILSLIVLVSGSLWPVILIHAVQDWTSGDLGFRAVELARGAEPATAGAITPSAAAPLA
jgi:membrane protease YdiL (CAAX protease family)